VHVAGVQRQGDELRVHQEADEGHHADAAGEAGAGEHPQVDHRAGDVQRPNDVPAEQRDADRGRQHDRPHRGLGADPFDREQHRGEAGRQQAEAAQVAADGGRVARIVRDHQQRDGGHDDPERDVDEEDPPPVAALDEQAAEQRPEDRRDVHDEGQQAHHGPDPAAVSRAGGEREGRRLERPAAEALQDAEGDQGPGRPGQARERRAEDEHAEPDEEHPSAPEPLDRPAGHGQRDGGRQQVADADPADRGDRAVERRRERVDGDRDDRAVEHGHERGGRHHGDDEHGAVVERPVGAVRRSRLERNFHEQAT
jgi:hypothetical protein